MTRVLVVEDQESFSEPLAYILRRDGYEVSVVANGYEAIAEFERVQSDIVLLDLMLPGMSGVEVCRHLRQVSDVPVIMVTAKVGETDKVLGLEVGADDYVTKPYSTRELLARVRVLLRRSGDRAGLQRGVLQSGPVRMDVGRHVLTVNGEQVRLPLKEFELLEQLLRHAGRVLTRTQLLDRVWGSDYRGGGKTVDVHVKRIRARIEPDATQPRHLVTVRGVGYKLECGSGQSPHESARCRTGPLR